MLEDRGLGAELIYRGGTQRLGTRVAALVQRLDAGQWQPAAAVRGGLHGRAGNCANSDGDWRESLHRSELMEQVLRESGSTDAAIGMAMLVQDRCMQGLVHEAIRTAEGLPGLEGASPHLGGHHARAERRTRLFSGNYVDAAAVALVEQHDPWSRALDLSDHANALVRAGRADAAASVLSDLAEAAKRYNLGPPLAGHHVLQAMLALARGDIASARTWEARRIELASLLEEDWEPSLLLAIVEGSYASVLQRAQAALDRAPPRDLSPRRRIYHLIIKARAHHGLDQPAEARAALEGAHTLMEETGCLYDRCYYEEALALLTDP